MDCYDYDGEDVRDGAYVFSWDSWRGRAHGTEVTA